VSSVLSGPKNYDKVDSISDLEALISAVISSGQVFGFDIESGYDGPSREKGSTQTYYPLWKLVGFSFTNDVTWARYAPIAHDGSPHNLPEVDSAYWLWKLLATGRGVAHNAQFELHGLSRWFMQTLSDHPEVGSDVRASGGYFSVLSDTLIESYLAAETAKHGLKDITLDIFGHQMVRFEDLFPEKDRKKKTLRFNVLDVTPQVIEYACEDSLWCLAHHRLRYPTLKDTFLYKVEMGLLEILCAMEDFAIEFNWNRTTQKAKEAEHFLSLMDQEIQAELSEMVGEPVLVNLGSPKQVADVLYNKLGLPVGRRTATDSPSVSELALRGLTSQYPVVQKILRWKEMKTLLSRYLDKFPKTLNYAEDGRAHANHLQALVPSGRFAVSGFVYHQFPKKYHFELADGTSFDLNFRDLVISPPGHYILGYDLSQIELRVIAGLSSEPTLLRAFNEGEDVHAVTTATMLGIPLSKVTKEKRAIGKELNFALAYGMNKRSLAERLVIPVSEASDLYDSYFATYSSISDWTSQAVQEGTRDGYVHTLFGRKVTIRELQSDVFSIRSKGERLCVNSRVQGTAADYMKIAMVRIYKALKEADLLDRVHLVMNIHDALEFYVEDSLSPSDVISVIQDAAVFEVPGLPKILAEWHVGPSWGSVQDIIVGDDGSVEEAQFEEGSPEFDLDESLAQVGPLELPESESSGPPLPVQSVPVTLVVTIPSMPTLFQFQTFLDFLEKAPGSNKIKLVTPEGELDLSDVHSTGVTLDQSDELSRILGGARVSLEGSLVVDIPTGDLDL
jgi:DNA polymerase-1